MAGLFGTRTNAAQPTKYTQLNIQTSCLGGVIPVGYGQNRWTDNLIWYANFQSAGGGKGGVKTGVIGGAGAAVAKGGKGGGGSYTCALQLALGEAPPLPQGGLILHQIWVDSGTTTLGSLGLYLANGHQTTAPAFQRESYPNAALVYQGIGYLVAPLYQLGADATVPQHNFEVQSAFSGGVPGWPDASFADIIPDMIANPVYGIDPGAPYIDPVSLEQYRTYCYAQTLIGSPYMNQAEQMTSIIDRYRTLTNSWIFWSGTAIKFVPLASSPVTYKAVTYTPNNQPIFDFGPDDYLPDREGKPPLTVTRSDPRDGYNRVELDTQDRNKNYETNPVYWEDLGSNDLYGLLQSNTISCPEICDPGVAGNMAALIGQRSVYVRNTYTFKVSADTFGILVETGDIVTVTEPNIGLTRFPIRIQDVSGDDKGALTIIAEEFPEGIGLVTAYAPQTNLGTYAFDPLASPGSVNPPMILEPPLAVTGGVPEIWIGASGSLSSWGGADVYLSTDGTNYAHVGAISSATQQGTLTAGLPEGPDPDLTDVLSIDTAESGALLSTGITQQQADLFQTASLVDSEIISYGTVSLTGTNTWNLSYLRRAIYSTGAAAHAAGAQWWRINPAAALQYNLPKNYVGQNLFVKLCSFNLFGNSGEQLSDVVAYEYLIQGLAYQLAAPSYCTLAIDQPYDTAALNLVATWSASASEDATGYELQFSSDGGATWPVDHTFGAESFSFTLSNVATQTTFLARVRATNSQTASVWRTSSALDSGVPGLPPSEAPTSLSASLAPVVPYVVLEIGPAAGGAVFPILRATASGTASVIGTATSLSYTDTTAAPGTKYTYFAEAQNAYGNAGRSAGATITTGTSTGLTLMANGTILLSGGVTLTATPQPAPPVLLTAAGTFLTANGTTLTL